MALSPSSPSYTNYNSDLLVHREYRGALGIKDPGPIEPLVPVLPYNYKFNVRELQDEMGLNFYDYGARNYDPALGRWMNIDALADKYIDKSPYNYAINNPINMLDPDGNFVVSAEFVRRYPNITAYLKNNIKSDVMNSSIIMAALYNNTAKDSPDGKTGNLTREVLDVVLTFGKGPKIVSSKKPAGGFMGAIPNGAYIEQSGNIEISEARLVYLEQVLANKNATNADKQQALLGGFMLILHELTHYGDYLDGLRQEGGEPGIALEYEIWWLNKFGNEYTDNTDKFDKNTQAQIIEEKRNNFVIPTIPEHPGSAGPADGSAGPADGKKKFDKF